MICRVRDSVYVLGYQALLGIEYTVINRAIMPIWRAPSSFDPLTSDACRACRPGRRAPAGPARVSLSVSRSRVSHSLSRLSAAGGCAPRARSSHLGVALSLPRPPPALRGRGINTGRKQYILYVSRGRSTSGWLKTAATRSVVHNARRGMAIAPPPCTWSIL